jgi:hypothetical protein
LDDAYSAVEKRKKGDVLRKASAEGRAASTRALTSVFAMMMRQAERRKAVMRRWGAGGDVHVAELWRCGDGLACQLHYPTIRRTL